ncbi:MAG: cell division protein FtsZ [Bacteroidia bacterium]|nr:cell division protein FtsZ [Bacteroidia bacterium]
MTFDMPADPVSIIKVIGVGGGGSNAVNHMYRQGIKDVNFVVCNTDLQALAKSQVPVKIQLGASLTEGRGAGNKPEVGKQAAIESLEEIIKVFSNNTNMVFITAGMGGGTGTGAAPIIAKAAKEMGILTVGIVTIPFHFEGDRRIQQAIDGINELKDYVDSLLVINNEKLREMYGNLTFTEAFAKADNVLTIAAKGIAEIITVPGILNVDFADVKTVMTNSGIAIMGSAGAEGEGRALKAIKEALTSPLLNNSDIRGTRNILLNLTSGNNEITMDEIGQITDYVQEAAGRNADIIWGHCIDDSIGSRINVTIIATGFGKENILELLTASKKEKDRIVDNQNKTFHELIIENDIKPAQTLNTGKNYSTTDDSLFEKVTLAKDQEKSDEKSHERKEQLKRNYDRLREMSSINSSRDLNEIETVPAFKRLNVEIEDIKHSEVSEVSKYSLSKDSNKTIQLKENNSFLHDKVD